MRRLKGSTLRTIAILAFVALTVAGLVWKTGAGTLSSFGYRTISAVCPLGGLEVMIAEKTLLPRPLLSLLLFAVIAVLLGRVFCAWVCPVPLSRRLLGRKGASGGSGNGGSGNGSSADNASGRPAGVIPASDFHPQNGSPRVSLDSRHWVLGGALLSTAIFGFPVFCLVCPIGLTFATLIGVWRLFEFNEPTVTLLVFPAVLALELVVFRKWCRKICPLGALVSLVSGLNRFFRPEVDAGKCLRTTKGIDCTACKSACFEEIDLHHASSSQPLSECTKCRECSDACPVSAISFPLWAKKSESSRQRVEAALPPEEEVR